MNLKKNRSSRSILVFCGIAIFVVAALFIPFEITQNHSLWSRILDVGHVPLFFLVSCGVYFFLDSLDQSEKLKLGMSFLVGAIIAAIVEVIQPYFGRSAELNDWVNGALGSLLASLFLISLKRSPKFIPTIIFLLCSAVVVTFSSYPVYLSWRAMIWQNKSFPVVATFENQIELFLWSATLERGKSASSLFERSQLFSSQGEYSLLVTTLPNRYSGVILDLGNLDVSKMNTLEFELFTEDEEIQVSIRIDDDGQVVEYGDRFNKVVPIKKGVTNVMIPIEEIRRGGGNRRLNLNSLRRAIFFIGKQAESKQFYIDNIRFQ